jgi:transposase-like protein
MAIKTSKVTVLNENYNRTFSDEFKKSVVKDLVKGLVKIKDVCELHNVTRTSVYKWLYLYSNTPKGTKTVIQMESEAHKTKELYDRVSRLERVIGQKQLEIDYLSKLIQISSEDLGFDLKKKAEQILLNGSEQKVKVTPKSK